jgi:hypothetical protein
VAYGIWSLIQGREPRPRGDGASLARNLLLGMALLAACGILALGAGWAAAVGEDVVVAGLVIVAGAMLAVAAFVRPVRWMIAPALALALPLAVVSAANIEVDNSIGERTYRPITISDVRNEYELGMGSLTVDLRGVEFPTGDRRLKLKVGIGEAVLLVPENVCVASEAQVGVGDAEVFTQNQSGVDVDWQDPRVAKPTMSRLVLDASVGVGHLQVGYDRNSWQGFRFRGYGDRFFDSPDNLACVGSRATA